MNPTLFYLIAGACISFMIGRVAIPRIILIAKRKRIFDTPNPRKIHTQQIPRLGGVSFLPGMLIAYFLIRGIQCTIGGNGMPDVETIYQETIFYFFTGLITIAAVGLWDDIIGLTYKYKLLVQLFVALLLVLPAGRIVNLEGIFGIYAIPDWMSTPLTVLIVMVVINAFNLIDGMDGLCSGLSIVTLLTLTVLLVHSDNPMLALLSASTVGVVAAFFRYNYFGKRLKVFMGDCGSLTLGYITAFLLLQLASANNGTGNSQLTLVTLMTLSSSRCSTRPGCSSNESVSGTPRSVPTKITFIINSCKSDVPSGKVSGSSCASRSSISSPIFCWPRLSTSMCYCSSISCRSSR